MTTRLVFDTDIGTDVDDCLALAMVLGSPEIHLDGVTCVYGDVKLRARMVSKLLRLHHRATVPVYLGVQPPLLGLKPIYWPGHEGVGLLSDDDPPFVPPKLHAVQYLIEHVLANPNQVHLLAIGPLTNVAMALRLAPEMGPALKGLTIMGGVVRGPGDWDLPYAEHNIVCDPEAAHIVFSAGIPINLVPLDVTTKVRIFPAGVDRIRAGGTPYHQAVADQVDKYPPFGARGWTHLHDPLAAATIVDPSLVTWEPLHVDVELGGRHGIAATLARTPSEKAPANCRVAMKVDVQRVEEFVVSRIASDSGE